MKNDPLFKFIAIAVIFSLVIAFTSAARAEETKQIDRSGSYTTSKGGSGTASSFTIRSQGSVTRSGTWTNAAGGTGNWQSQTQWNKGTQTGTTTGSVTRPSGATTTWQGNVTRNGPGSFSNQGTLTRANGNTATYSGTNTRVAPGAWDRNEVVTGANGKVTDRNVQTTVNGGQGTRVVTTSLPNGHVVTKDAAFDQTSATPTPPHQH